MLHAREGWLSLVSPPEKIPTKHFRNFSCTGATISAAPHWRNLCSRAGPGLPSPHQWLAKKSWLRPPGSWTRAASGQGSAKTKASHPVDVLAKITPGPAVVDLSLASAEDSLSHRHMALQGESLRASPLLALLKCWWPVRNSRRETHWTLECVSHADVTLSNCY